MNPARDTGEDSRRRSQQTVARVALQHIPMRLLVLLWSSYEHENIGTAVVFARNVLRSLVGDSENILRTVYGLYCNGCLE